MKLKLKILSPVVVANTLRAFILLSMIMSFINCNYLNLFIGAFTLFLTFLPFIIVRSNHIILPSSFQVIILLFIFAASYLGEMRAYYIKFWWWDIMLHALSGLILGFVGFLLVYILNKEQKINVFLSSIFMSLFAFCFAVSIGALWEIFEFTMDSVFNTNMQKSGLVDTMWDLILDTIGAMAASFYGYLYVKHGHGGIFKNLLNKFIKLNQSIFKKNK